MHGGVLFTLMDEAVAWAVYYSGFRAVTAKAETRFRVPIPVGASLVITGSVVERARRLVRVRAEIQRDDSSDEKVADMVATMYLLDDAAFGTGIKPEN
jgi:acyl-coenzyme A thioesterase PaaI-like protein